MNASNSANLQQGRPAAQAVALESMAPSTTTDIHPTSADDSPSNEENCTTPSEPIYEKRHAEDDPEYELSSQSSNVSSNDSGGQDLEQIQKLVSRMFGRERKANSEEEKTRHSGVVWKGLTVKGVGAGAVLQPTIADIFLGIPRLVKKLLTRRRKGGKPPVRTIIDGFTVSLSRGFIVKGLLLTYTGLRPTGGDAPCFRTTWFRVLYFFESHRESKVWV